MSRLPALLALVVPLALLAQRKPIKLDSIADLRVRAAEPGAPVWAPDGKRFVYTVGHQVWLYDVPSRTARELFSMTALERAATPPATPAAFDWENRRVSESRVQWFPSGAELLIAAGGDLFRWRIATGGVVQLTATAEAERDPKLSPDGRLVSLRRGHELYVLSLDSGRTTRLTHDASDTVWNGQLDWVYPEELELGTAHWWSPDSTSIAYLQFDVAREPLYPHADLLGLGAIAEPQRYPKPGEPNAEVRVGVVAARGGATRWMNLGDARDSLTARVAWLPDSASLAVTRLNRVQNRLDLMLADAASGEVRRLLAETDTTWINLQDHLKFLANRREFLWSSERSGYRHLYLYTMDGHLEHQLTRGAWEVTAVAGVDEAARRVYYLSTEETPLEQHLYVVGLDGGERRRLSAPSMTHAVAMSPTCEYYLDTSSSLIAPPRKVLRRGDGSEWTVFREADRKPLEEHKILPTEIVPVRAEDGATLYGRLIRPADFRPDRKYPVVVVVYGGPAPAAVQNAWRGIGWEQVMAHRGFVIWQLDNRGSLGRGHAWESALYRRLGARELEDQKRGVAHLVSMGFVDAARVGIYGWSYGGFMTLYALLNAPEVFKAGVAGAPVTDWRCYDSIYTERYLGLPADNPEGYRLSSPVNFAEKLAGRLLLVHNIEDDNVLFQHTLRMADALERAGKPFQSVIYPQKSHGVSGAARGHLNQAITEFFEKNL
jgi:dipeptidyl-peptidase 4